MEASFPSSILTPGQIGAGTGTTYDSRLEIFNNKLITEAGNGLFNGWQMKIIRVIDPTDNTNIAVAAVANMPFYVNNLNVQSSYYLPAFTQQTDGVGVHIAPGYFFEVYSLVAPNPLPAALNAQRYIVELTPPQRFTVTPGDTGYPTAFPETIDQYGQYTATKYDNGITQRWLKTVGRGHDNGQYPEVVLPLRDLGKGTLDFLTKEIFFLGKIRLRLILDDANNVVIRPNYTPSGTAAPAL